MKKGLITLLLGLVAAGITLGHSFASDRSPTDGDDRVEAPSKTPTAKKPTARRTPRIRLRTPSDRIIEMPLRPATLDALDVDHPIRLLPADTTLVAWTDDLSAVTSDLGIATLLTRHRDMLQELDEELSKVGLDLMDLADPSGLGIDPVAPAALAILGLEQPVVVLAARVSDSDAIEQAIETFTASTPRQFEKEVLNEAAATIEASERPRMAFLLRGGYLYVLATDAWNADVNTALAQIAFQDPEESLPTTAAWRESVPSLSGRVGKLFVNAPAMHAQTVAELQSAIDRDRRVWVNAEGEPDEWAQEHIARMEGGLSLVEAFFGGLGGVAFGADFENGDLIVDGTIALAPDSLVSNLFRNATRQSALQRALDVQPVYLIDGAMDPVALKRFVELSATALGADLDRAMAMAKGFADLPADPLDLLNGEFGLAVVVDELTAESPTWGFTFTFGVTDVAAARTAIDRVGTLAWLSELIKTDEETGGVSIDTPFWRTIHIAAVGDDVIATTEREHIANLAWGSGRLARTYDDVALSRLAGNIGDVGRMFFDYDAISPAFGPPPSEHDLDGWRARERELGLSMLSLLGTSALTARLDGNSLRLRGGLFTDAHSMGDFLAALTDIARAMEEERPKPVFDPPAATAVPITEPVMVEPAMTEPGMVEPYTPEFNPHEPHMTIEPADTHYEVIIE